MAKQSDSEKDENEQGGDAQKRVSSSDELNPQKYSYFYEGKLDNALSSLLTGSMGIPLSSVPAAISLYDFTYDFTSPGREALGEEIAQLKKENRRLFTDIRTTTLSDKEKAKRISELEKNNEELGNKQRFQYLLNRVNDKAVVKLLQSEKFRAEFERQKTCFAVVMAVDIRRSTELMLKARKPERYAEFITALCSDLTKIILNNFGVFDKFTGDGILAFFPDFYTGEDAVYWSLKAAVECHSSFSRHYQASRDCFISVRMDVCLGIGVDYGECHLVKMQDGLTVIGSPVVYACRLSDCGAGQTLLNQPAYEVVSEKFGGYVNFQESELDIKHEGKTLVYVTSLSKKKYNPNLPQWARDSETPNVSSTPAP